MKKSISKHLKLLLEEFAADCVTWLIQFKAQP